MRTRRAVKRQRRKPSLPQPDMWTKEDLMAGHPNRLVPAIITASYIYYHQPDMRGIMSDTDFDWACQELLKRWDDVTHVHKIHITKGDLSAGTLFSLRPEDYPAMAKNCALSMSEGRLTVDVNGNRMSGDELRALLERHKDKQPVQMRKRTRNTPKRRERRSVNANKRTNRGFGV